MSEENEILEGEEEEFIEVKEHDLMELFEVLSFAEKWRRVKAGMNMPKDTGEYKWAKLQMIRLLAPVAAVFVPILLILIIAVFAAMMPEVDTSYQVTVMEPEEAPELDEIEEIEEEPPEPPDPEDVEFDPDVTVMSPTPTEDFSPQPAEFDAVAMVKSPVIMKNIYGNRNPGARGSALGRFGGGSATEGAVMRALRWLKKTQNADGSWPKTRPAITSMALLAYLAHGETPASEEFGPTVEKAIRFLVDSQNPDGTFKGKDGHNYTQPIVAYALSEAYGLTKIPMIKEAAERAVDIVIKGQTAAGGWDYNCNAGSDRDDTSYMGWCAQSLKAAKMAGLGNDGLHSAMGKAIKGFRKNYHQGGGFGYTSPSATHGLTGVGVLCMQLLGAGREIEVRKGLMTLTQTSFVDWKAPKGTIYFWYYNTQAFFHAGGDMWNAWNKQFSVQLVKNQNITKKAIADPKGKMRDIGWWDGETDIGEKGHSDGKTMDTALCTLMLEVYYRYLPTFQAPKEEEFEEEVESEDDIEIDIDV